MVCWDLVRYFPLLSVEVLLFVTLILADEVEKLQKHLGLLKQQYVKLQERYYELEQRHLQCQAAGTARPEGSLVAQLVRTVAGLHEQELYRFALRPGAGKG